MRVISLATVLASALLAATACSSTSGASDGATSPVTPDSGAAAEQDAGNGVTPDAAEGGELGGDRPVTLHVPPGYQAGVAAPLVILLHGYSASGALQDLYFGMTALSDTRGFLYAHPDGLVDADGKRYWNASDACCDFAPTNVDDSAYLSALIKQIQARYTVDAKRIFLVGHSNGGFMSYRMACDHSDQIAAIASLAGAMASDVTKCASASPVSVLQIHGTADGTIAYEGGQIAGHGYPSAKTTVSTWATIDGCSTTPETSSPPLDADTKLPGPETTVTRYASGCKPGGHAELWTIAGGSHIPSLTPTFTASVIDFLYAHPKP